jgi:membrane protease YdiL (CAAX protease family)
VSLPVSVCIGTLGPAIACFVSHRMETGNWRAVRLFPPLDRRSLWLLGGPLAILFCRFFVFAALITKGGPVAWRWHPGVLAGILIPMFNYNLFGGPLFEEFGWRGYLQSRLQQMLPPWIAAIAVGILWSIWHLPLFLVGWSGASAVSFTSILIGVSLIMAFAFNASGEAVLVAILMHSALNASNRFVPGFLADVPLVEWPSEVALVVISFLAVALIATALSRGSLCARIGTNK